MNKGTILIELQKAFDTLEHKIFLKKMTYLGFKTSIIKWFESYLQSKKYCVPVDDSFSEPKTLNCGVSQGSILWSLPFFIWINDLPQSLQKGSTYLYADNTWILSKQKHSQIWRYFNKRIINTLQMVHW